MQKSYRCGFAIGTCHSHYLKLLRRITIKVGHGDPQSFSTIFHLDISNTIFKLLKLFLIYYSSSSLLNSSVNKLMPVYLGSFYSHEQTLRDHLSRIEMDRCYFYVCSASDLNQRYLI